MNKPLLRTVLGDPRGASAAEGEELLTAMTARLVAAVGRRWPGAEPEAGAGAGEGR